jgi:hypothetical protein
LRVRSAKVSTRSMKPQRLSVSTQREVSAFMESAIETGLARRRGQRMEHRVCGYPALVPSEVLDRHRDVGVSRHQSHGGRLGPLLSFGPQRDPLPLRQRLAAPVGFVAGHRALPAHVAARGNRPQRRHDAVLPGVREPLHDQSLGARLDPHHRAVHRVDRPNVAAEAAMRLRPPGAARPQPSDGVGESEPRAARFKSAVA